MDLLALIAFAAFGIVELICHYRAKAIKAEAEADRIRQELDAERWARDIIDIEAAEETIHEEMLAEENRHCEAWDKFKQKWNPGLLARFRLRMIYGSLLNASQESRAWGEFLKTQPGYRSKLLAKLVALSKESRIREAKRQPTGKR